MRTDGGRADGRDLPGALVLSLDFELGSGNLDRLHRDPGYRQDVLRAREVVPRLLELFEEFQVGATWAIVGSLFGDDRKEWRGQASRDGSRADFAPSGLDLSVRLDEPARPAELAPSLIRQIVRAPGHEIATHTFSHFFWMERRDALEAFRLELRAAKAVAKWWSLPLTSIVFPRNQYEPVLAPVLLSEGITAYRGNPPNRMWRFEGAADANRPMRRAGRLLDAYLPVSGKGTVPWSEIVEPTGVSNVRASFFLRPYTPGLRALEGVRLRRLRSCMYAAAKRRELLHLWWHPHNFGRHAEQNLAFLRSLLETFGACRSRWGMRSLTMTQVDRMARGRPADASSAPARSV